MLGIVDNLALPDPLNTPSAASCIVIINDELTALGTKIPIDNSGVLQPGGVVSPAEAI
jgi:hypothetical protein